MAKPRKPSAALRTLCKLHHVQPSYAGSGGKRIAASAEALVAILSGLGVDASTPSKIDRAIARRVKAMRSRVLEPVTVAWKGKLALTLRLNGKSPKHIDVTIEPEAGETVELRVPADRFITKTKKDGLGEPEELTTIKLPGTLPMGYHTARVTVGRTEHETRVLSAPTECFRHDEERLAGAWGLFCPTYALRSERDTGCGDLTELRRAAAWSASQGGKVIATLPLLSVYLDEPFEPSPYSPVSKLFWNELFLDAEATQEFDKTPKAKRRVASAGYRKEKDALRAGSLVQYRRQAALRRSVVEHLAQRFFEKGGMESPEMQAYLEANPLAPRYARFRAVMERQQRDWSDWSERLRSGKFRKGDFDPAAEQYHLYAQLRTSEQLDALQNDMQDRDGLLYLDLAVGVRGDGFDAFINPSVFANALSVGAPPDSSFHRGQDWGFPPMHPDALREDRYAYFIDTVRAHMQRCDVLRLDHVMAFYRLFLVPSGIGLDARSGAYVHFNADEQLAIYSIESHRNACMIVGENLGTVPPQVEKALDKHKMGPLYVGQYEAKANAKKAIGDVRPRSVASCNTHDMAPFAKWWDGSEADDRMAVGLVNEETADQEKAWKANLREKMTAYFEKKGEVAGEHAGQVRDAVHKHLASGPCDFMLVNIEDLWLESHCQNIPGTVDEHPNWRHRLRYELDEIAADSDVEAQLSMIDAARQKAPQPKATTATATSSR